MYTQLDVHCSARGIEIQTIQSHVARVTCVCPRIVIDIQVPEPDETAFHPHPDKIHDARVDDASRLIKANHQVTALSIMPSLC